MRKHVELPYPLGAGVDTYNPPYVNTDVRFLRLHNVQPRRNRLFTARGLDTIQELEATGGIVAFASYTEPTSLYSSLYALSPTSVFSFDFQSTEFNAAPIYTNFANDHERYVIVPWYDRVYVSKLNSGTVKLQGNVATLITGIPAGRYGLCSNSHLMFANISTPSGNYPNRVQWSDLYEPEDFIIDTDSQADFFDTEQADGECTGLSYQRGSNVLYVREAIWIGQFNSATGKYKFEPLYTGIGNLYHHAVVRVKELDFFISKDGIYALDGLQLRTVGDAIWEFFKNDITTDLTKPVYGTYDANNHEVFWTYLNKSSVYSQIVYNYKEEKWSTRGTRGELTRLQLDTPVRGYTVIDSYSDLIDSSFGSTHLIDGDWQYTSYAERELIGGTDGNIYKISSTNFAEVDETPIGCVIETTDFVFAKVEHTKEFHKAILQHTKVGTPVINLEIAVRNNLSQTLTWSTPVSVDNIVGNGVSFFFRNLGAGKFIRFRLTITNTTVDSVANAVDELYLLSLIMVSMTEDDDVD